MAAIQSLPALTLRKLCSGQAIPDVPSIVKELIENALDAQATSVTLKLVNHGLTAITVTDNGQGIPAESHAFVGTRHGTSKLQAFDDLWRVHSFGFRGEALYAICSLAYQVQITTRTASDPVAVVLTLNSQGEQVQVRHVPNEPGTSVFVQKPFYNIPVRRQRAEKNATGLMQQIARLLLTYAFIYPTVRFALQVQHTLASRKRPLPTALAWTHDGARSQWIKLSTTSPWEAIAHSLGKEAMRGLMRIRVIKPCTPTATCMADEEGEQGIGDPPWFKPTDDAITIDAILPCGNPDGCTRPAGVKSIRHVPFLYINRRPVAVHNYPLQAMVSLARQAWRATMNAPTPDANQPFLWIHIQAPVAWCDINIEPTKSHILFADPSIVLDAFTELVAKAYPGLSLHNPAANAERLDTVMPAVSQSPLSAKRSNLPTAVTNLPRPAQTPGATLAKKPLVSSPRTEWTVAQRLEWSPEQALGLVSSAHQLPCLPPSTRPKIGTNTPQVSLAALSVPRALPPATPLGQQVLGKRTSREIRSTHSPLPLPGRTTRPRTSPTCSQSQTVCATATEQPGSVSGSGVRQRTLDRELLVLPTSNHRQPRTNSLLGPPGIDQQSLRHLSAVATVPQCAEMLQALRATSWLEPGRPWSPVPDRIPSTAVPQLVYGNHTTDVWLLRWQRGYWHVDRHQLYTAFTIARLARSFVFPIQSLPTPLVIKAMPLNQQRQLQTLEASAVDINGVTYHYVTDPRIVANGYNCRWFQGRSTTEDHYSTRTNSASVHQALLAPLDQLSTVTTPPVQTYPQFAAAVNPNMESNSSHLRQEANGGRFESWRRKLALGGLAARRLTSVFREAWDDDFEGSDQAQLELPAAVNLSQRSVRRDLVRVRQIAELVDWLRSLRPAVEDCLQAYQTDHRAASISLAQKSLLCQLEQNWAQALFLMDLVDESSHVARQRVRQCANATPLQDLSLASRLTGRTSVDSGCPVASGRPDPPSRLAHGKAPASPLPNPDSDDEDDEELLNEVEEFVAEDDADPFDRTDSPRLRIATQVSLLSRLMEYRQLIQEHPASHDATLARPGPEAGSASTLAVAKYDVNDRTHIPPIMFTVDNLWLLMSECKSLVASVEATLSELQI
ncbi:hypothetical protein H4R35_000233 [Dimargaris xerosporica]|nr:hypothetical protein H4R35_000233 [Dimargaris xerosporica]